MTQSSESKVVMFDDNDPQMQEAYRQARKTFRYFWRELAWERRRIVPALDLAAVKAPFSDGEQAEPSDEHPDVEHMWLDEVDFDGKDVSGVLLNEPNWLKTVSVGDEARVPLGEINDWMYAIGGEVYGAFTVNLMRSRMSPGERRQHDAAWGLKFGDPATIRLVPQPKPAGGFFKRLFGGNKDDGSQVIPEEHPMSENMGPTLAEAIAQNPSLVKEADDNGWTMLHHQALAGSTASVKVLLEHGADPNAKTNDGATPLELAKSLRWEKVAAVLEKT